MNQTTVAKLRTQLAHYNRWRRGEEEELKLTPAEIGVLLDQCLLALALLAAGQGKSARRKHGKTERGK